MSIYQTATWLLTNLLLLLIATLILIYIYTSRNYNYWKSKNVIHIKPVPVVGNLWAVVSGKAQVGMYLGELYHKFKDEPYFGIYVLDKPYLVLRSPDIIKKVLIKDFRHFTNRNFGGDVKADPLAANSLFIMKNPDWKSLRIMLTPTFTSGKMKLMLPIMNEYGKKLEKYAEKVEGQTVEIKDICTRYTTDLIASCAFGIEANSFQDDFSGFRMVSKRLFTFSFFRGIKLFSYFFAPKLVALCKLSFIDSLSAGFVRKVFSETICSRKSTGISRNDFVDLLIGIKESQKRDFDFDSDRMVSTALTFFTAGYETTGSLIAFTLYELCMNPDVQTKLRKEILEKIEKHGNITYEAIQDMKYLNMVTSEVLRKYPFGPFLNRYCEEDYLIEETGLLIEKGVSILVPLCGLHYDPTHFPQPEKFDPDRFNEENKQEIPSCLYMPFGEGPRNCIGDRFGLLSGKVGVIHILKDFAVEKCAETPFPLVLNPKSPFIAPIAGLPMKLVRVN
nr:cytochrome P450 monooxygenase CYP345F10 [Lasioderma serricorne]